MIIMLLLSANSYATNTPKPVPTGNVNTSNIDTSAKAYSDAQAYSGALAIGQGGNASAQGGNGGQGIGTANGFGGQSVTTVQNVGNTSNNIPRQAPMAYAPNIQLGANAFNCSNSASFGASSPFGGVSLGIPLTADNCPTFVMSQYLYSIGQPVQGCEILNNIDEIAEVRKQTGFSCIQPIAVTPVAYDPTWLNDFNRRFPPIDKKLSDIHKDRMSK